MRQGPNNKRMRGRGTGRKHSNPRNQNFESNGPDVKVRGNPQQVVEKYLALARDASSAGDRISAESYYQHAEHYYRVMNANAPNEQRQATPASDSANGADDSDQTAAEQQATSEETAEAHNGAANGDGSGGANGGGRRRGGRRRKESGEQPQSDAEAVSRDDSTGEEAGETASA